MKRTAKPTARQRRALALAIAALCLIAVSLAPAAASAAPPLFTQFGTTGSGAGQTSAATGVATDPATGNVYVADQANHRISEFTVWGEFVKAWGWGVIDGSPELQTCTTTCQAGLAGSGAGEFGQFFLQGIAVDASGDVYVLDEDNHRVQKFDPSGSSVQFELMIGGGVNQGGGTPATPGNLCTAAHLANGDSCGAGSVGTGNGQFGPWKAGPIVEGKIGYQVEGNFIAVGPGPSGPIYVGDTGRIQEFNLDGTYKGDLPDPTGLLAGETVQALAVDPKTGDLYVTFSKEESAVISGPSAKEDVHKLSPAGADLGTIKVKIPTALATDAAGNLYVFDRLATSDFILGPPILKLNPAGTLIESFGKEEFGHVVFGIATSSACGIPGTDVYVSNPSSVDSYVNAYGSPPDVSLCPPPKVPPTISAQYAVSVDTDGATLKAQINPHFWPDTTYYVQYGIGKCSEGGCDRSQPIAPGSKLTGATTNASLTSTGVFLTGLAPDTTYHYRFVAQSGGGGPVVGVGGVVGSDGSEAAFHTFPLAEEASTACPNQAFRIGASAKLPDCRAYELVSPLDKNNADISTGNEDSFSQVSADGQRATYSSARSFANPQGAPFFSQYLAIRDPVAGWSTRSISPPRSALSFYVLGLFSLQYKAFSDDLCSGWLVQDVDVALAPGAPAGVPNLYRRDLCGDSGYELMTSAPPPGFGGEFGGSSSALSSTYYPDIEGSSADASRSVFHADAKLTPNACPTQGIFQVYVAYDGGKKLRLVSQLPNGEAACVHSAAGTDQGNPGDFRRDSLYHAVSDDGSRVFWSASGGNGKEVLASGGGGNNPQPGELYVRLNATMPPGKPGTGCTEAEKACTIVVSSDGDTQFWSADPEGKTAIYTTGDGNPETLDLRSSTADLYEFDVDSATPHLIAEGVRGVVGASEDVSRIYFVSVADLAAGATAGKSNLYLYEKGSALTFVAMLGEAETNGEGAYGDPERATVDNLWPFLRNSRVSPDGLHATFVSKASLTGYDNTDANSGQPDNEVYLYDASAKGGAGELRCVSCNPSGARPSGRRCRHPRRQRGR